MASWASLAFALGTLFFPFATMGFEHNVAATGLLTAFWLLSPALEQPRLDRRRIALGLAGLATGWAAISSYIAVVPILMSLVWFLSRCRQPRDLLWVALGLSVPLAVVLSYHQACFGTPFTTSYHFQNPQFQETDAFLRVIERPRFDRLVGVLISPFRGVFFSSPVMLLGAIGLAAWARTRARRAEAVLFAGIFGFFLLFNVCFNGWHGGWGVGPRYLIPGLPFLALPMVWGFRRHPRTSKALALLSIGIMSLFTAVDPQPSVGVSGISRFPARPHLLREPLTEYAIPIFVTGRAGPILDAQVADRLRRTEEAMRSEGATAAQVSARLDEARADARRGIERGAADYPLAVFVGPVSANPIGVYEGWVGRLFPPPSDETRWNSFNAGGLLLPGSRLSLLFLALTSGPLVLLALGLARRAAGADQVPDCSIL